MGTYSRIITELNHYRPGWIQAMGVTDLATWINNWHPSVAKNIYLAALAEKKITRDMDDLVKATYLARAAFMAMDGHSAKALVADPTFRLMVDMTISARKEELAELKIARTHLLEFLKGLLPPSSL